MKINYQSTEIKTSSFLSSAQIERQLFPLWSPACGRELSSKWTYYAEEGSGLDASHGEAVHERRLSGGRKWHDSEAWRRWLLHMPLQNHSQVSNSEKDYSLVSRFFLSPPFHMLLSRLAYKSYHFERIGSTAKSQMVTPLKLNTKVQRHPAYF